ncbi:hypothetical protein ACTHSJ_05825 [Paenibacillus cellulositrophicus]|uniref:hypothetical protein n=1 Tax=Paenibacillus cellulositrophicus TaxID=562959 RepID=UPI003F7F4D0A
MKKRQKMVWNQSIHELKEKLMAKSKTEQENQNPMGREGASVADPSERESSDAQTILDG